MDEFSIDKHWNEFVEEGLYILCTTKELAEEFLRYCHKQQMVWSTGECLLNYSCWETEYKEGITYRCDIEDGNLVYTSVPKINSVEFTGFGEKVTLTPTVLHISPVITYREIIEVIYHRSETIVLIKTLGKHYKGVSRCDPTDTYSKEFGFTVAYERARENQDKGRY